MIQDQVKGATILVIDDDADIRESIRTGLEVEGHKTTVLTAPNGVSGLQMMSQQKFDLVILDLNMPGGDGFAVAKEIRARPPLADTKILMLTASDERADIWKSIDHEVDDYLTKPFELTELEVRAYALLTG